MVVLAAAILSKNGKVLVSRQYVDMNRIRIEGILAAFPKLIDEDSDGNAKQHTYVETGSIRYVYQPMEGLYLLLVTTRGSNIVQDLDTLRLLSKVVAEYSHVSEEDVSRNVFELVFAFDEVITLGYKENITLQGIRTNLEMESHEEKLHMMIKQSKMNEAKDEARRKAASIKASKIGQTSMQGIGPMQGMGNTPGMDSMGGFGGSNSSMGGFGGSSPSTDMGMGGGSTSPSSSTYGRSSSPTSKPVSGGMKLGKGMRLGNKGGKGLSMMQQMAKEEGIDANALVQQQSAKANIAAPGAVVRSDPIEIRVSEAVTVMYDKDGALHKLEVKGTISLLCHEDSSKIRVQLDPYGDTSMFQFQPHPNLSKPEFQKNNILQNKNIDKAFPKDKLLGVLKWRYASKEDETMVPLRVTCWPESNGDGTVTVNLELELAATHLVLQNVVVTIPLSSSDPPEVTSLEGGMHRHVSKRHVLEWEMNIVDKENSTCSMEFIAPGNNEADFFPVEISFVSTDTICPMHVAQVEDLETNEPAKFGLYKQLQTEKYEIAESY
uniref:Coatomer subunit delta n=1 Tax=Mucochytrium quahogii TaxID=96639 RepID=A0A7S2S5S1_9STRA|mmetsp:Transcript_27295/g.43872  ORF Transcript_27295/g.43872 Transcript_27295/m.43872 type:complete len:548 (-) Transcript_27295:27-1670(-)